jgi:hypothetical protein
MILTGGTVFHFTSIIMVIMDEVLAQAIKLAGRL